MRLATSAGVITVVKHYRNLQRKTTHLEAELGWALNSLTSTQHNLTQSYILKYYKHFSLVQNFVLSLFYPQLLKEFVNFHFVWYNSNATAGYSYSIFILLQEHVFCSESYSSSVYSAVQSRKEKHEWQNAMCKSVVTISFEAIHPTLHQNGRWLYTDSNRLHSHSGAYYCHNDRTLKLTHSVFCSPK
jgi:hypothetical protein